MKKTLGLLVLAMALIVPAPAFSAAPEPVSITGLVGLINDAGTSFVVIFPGQGGNPINVGSLGGLSDAAKDCLLKAAQEQKTVTVNGVLLPHSDGSNGMIENTVQCIPK